MDTGAKKKMKKKAVDWSHVGHAWQMLEMQLGPISFAQTAANFARMQDLMDALLVQTSSSDANPALFNLLDCLSDWVEAYETSFVPIGSADPVQALKHLMEANGLRQKDLADVLGGQSVVSAVLSGKRAINAGQAARLAKRFGVSAAVFIADPESPDRVFDGAYGSMIDDQSMTRVFASTGWEDCSDGTGH